MIETGLPLIYAAQVGGQDELVFDGASFAFNADKSLAFQMSQFETALAITEWHRGADGWRCDGGPMERIPEKEEADYRACLLGFRDYVNKNGFKSVVLGLSGGIDSSALAADLSPELCLTIDYGQRPAAGEIRASATIAAALGLRHEILRVDLSALGTGDMAGRDAPELASGPEWWPYRNQVLITLAAMRYVADGLSEIVIGAVGTDTHADGKAPFLDAIDRTLSVQEGGVRVRAPARDTDPVELLRRSALPRDLVGLTFSCHSGPYSCGQCRGCTKRLATIEAFRSAEG